MQRKKLNNATSRYNKLEKMEEQTEKSEKKVKSKMGTNDIGARDSFCALDLLVAASLLGKRISIGSIRKNARIISMNDVIDIVIIKQLVHEIFSDGIRGVGDHLIHPLYSFNHDHPKWWIADYMRKMEQFRLLHLISIQIHIKETKWEAIK